jgi:hypothetical protein
MEVPPLTDPMSEADDTPRPAWSGFNFRFSVTSYMSEFASSLTPNWAAATAGHMASSRNGNTNQDH